jgi:hypothetical protein
MNSVLALGRDFAAAFSSQQMMILISSAVAGLIAMISAGRKS